MKRNKNSSSKTYDGPCLTYRHWRVLLAVWIWQPMLSWRHWPFILISLNDSSNKTIADSRLRPLVHNPWWVLAGLYRRAKFGWNRCGYFWAISSSLTKTRAVTWRHPQNWKHITPYCCQTKTKPTTAGKIHRKKWWALNPVYDWSGVCLLVLGLYFIYACSL